VETSSPSGAAIIPSGPVTDRPAVPVDGYFRYNSTDNVFEGYKSGSWGEIPTGSFLPISGGILTGDLTGNTLVKTPKAQLGLSATATQNFTLTAAAADGTMKLARGNAGATTQDILTVDAAGKVAFPAGIAATVLTNSATNNALVTATPAKLGAVTLTPGLWFINALVTLDSVAAAIGYASCFINTTNTTDSESWVRHPYVPAVVLNTSGNGSVRLQTSKIVQVTANTEYAAYAQHAFSNGNACGATGTITATRIG